MTPSLNARALAALAAGWTCAATAQQPAAPAFAAPNLSPQGVRAMAASCATCHGTEGRPAPGSPLSPLAGKPREEIAQALSQFKSGAKPATLMHQISKGFSEAEIAALADHFSRLPR